MQVQVTQVTDVKPGRFGGMSSKIHAGNDFYYLNEDAMQYVGKTVEIEATQPPGKNYKTAKILNVVGGASASGNGNGHIEWHEYDKMMRLAHRTALELEPDYDNDGSAGGAVSFLDRSTARAALVNTVMIAFSNGKLWLDDDIPFGWLIVICLSVFTASL